MEEPNDQLNKMLEDCAILNKEQEKRFQDTMVKVDELEDKSQIDFIKKSLIDAKNGKLDVTSFLNNFNIVKDAD